jgi:hypothetical protein
MVALFDFTPQFCPNCGQDPRLSSLLTHKDYERKCSFICECGLHYQYVPDRQTLIEVARKTGGDLGQY